MATMEQLAANLAAAQLLQTVQQLVQRNLLQERKGAFGFAVEVVRWWFVQVA
jgi:hypothetical protein